MLSFYEWMRDFRHDYEPDVEKLAERVRQASDIYHPAQDVNDAKKIIDRDDEIREKDEYKKYATHAWSEFIEFREKLDARARGEGWFRWSPLIQILVVASLAAIILGSLAMAMFYGPFRESLARIEIARGVLTLFFGMGTVGVALILVTAAFTSQRPDAGPRFDMGKQVLTALIGVFGVIVGFYFGTELAETSGADSAVAENVASPLGDELAYVVRSTEDTLAGVKDGSMPDETVVERLQELGIRVQKLSLAVDELPKGARIVLADRLEDPVAKVKGLAYDVITRGEVNIVLRQKLPPIMAQFDGWSQPPP